MSVAPRVETPRTSPSTPPGLPSAPASAPRGAAAATALLHEVAGRVRTDLWGPAARETRRIAAGAIALALVIGANVGWYGTAPARIAGAGVVLLAVAVPLTWAIWFRAVKRDPRRTLLRAAPVLGHEAVERAMSGLTLAERITASPTHEGVSPALARMHAERTLAHLDVERLAPEGARRRDAARVVALLGLVAAIFGLVAAPARFVEGTDVLLARRGRAPLPLAWLDDVALVVHPPAYLHKDDVHGVGYGTIVADRGAALVVRGTPRRTQRVLMLADATHEVPFLDDGSGGVVAHWSVAASGRLRVLARFGDVVIEEPNGWDLAAIADETPTVELEGAPRTIELSTVAGAVPLRYDAYDDHGLREVHLVVRVGAKEERRVLAKLDSEPKHDRGGYMLRTSDPFIRKAKVPISVRVEARDNDAVTGPKWGRSAEIVLVPPVVGAAEAQRYEAVRAARETLVDFLAFAASGERARGGAETTGGSPLTTPPSGPPSAADLEEKWTGVSNAIESLVTASYEGLRLPKRMSLVLRGRARKVGDAIAAERKRGPARPIGGASAKSGAIPMSAIEHLTIGLDEAMRALGSRDARTIARTIAEIAEDGADALRVLGAIPPMPSMPPMARPTPAQENQEARGRLETDVKVLDGGGASMRRLGELGRDLGEIVENDLRRVARARGAREGTPPNAPGAELAMRDLAARMREPVPSFGGSMNPSAPGEPTKEDDAIGEESEGEQQAGDAESRLEELTKEHGGAIGEVEDQLRAAEDPRALEGLAEEAKRRAKELREAVRDLPRSGGVRRTLEASEASAREKAEAMAEALEALQIGDAKERGDSSLKGIDEAKERAWMSPGVAERLDDVQREVQKQVDWVDDVLARLRKMAAAKAAEKVRGLAPRERGLEGKARELGEGSEKTTPLPQGIKELLEQAEKKMGEAAGELEQGAADEGLSRQREAQRLLERARDAARGEEEQSGSSGDGRRPATEERLDIPKAEDHKGPEAFRKRVLDGLRGGASTPKLQEAVRRYAEGLIR